MNVTLRTTLTEVATGLEINVEIECDVMLGTPSNGIDPGEPPECDFGEVRIVDGDTLTFDAAVDRFGITAATENDLCEQACEQASEAYEPYDNERDCFTGPDYDGAFDE